VLGGGLYRWWDGSHVGGEQASLTQGGYVICLHFGGRGRTRADRDVYVIETTGALS